MEIIDKIVPAENKVYLQDGTELVYDYLIIATGADIAPEETEGLTGEFWQKKSLIFIQSAVQ